MKRNKSKRQEQNNKVERSAKPIIRVRSGLRAGALRDVAPCI